MSYSHSCCAWQTQKHKRRHRTTARSGAHATAGAVSRQHLNASPRNAYARHAQCTLHCTHTCRARALRRTRTLLPCSSRFAAARAFRDVVTRAGDAPRTCRRRRRGVSSYCAALARNGLGALHCSANAYRAWQRLCRYATTHFAPTAACSNCRIRGARRAVRATPLHAFDATRNTARLRWRTF